MSNKMGYDEYTDRKLSIMRKKILGGFIATIIPLIILGIGFYAEINYGTQVIGVPALVVCGMVFLIGLGIMLPVERESRKLKWDLESEGQKVYNYTGHF